MIDTTANKIANGRPDGKGNNLGSVGGSRNIKTNVDLFGRKQDSFTKNVYNTTPSHAASKDTIKDTKDANQGSGSAKTGMA